MPRPPDSPAWHELLAPLPADAPARRQPVGSPEVLAGPYGSAIAGWVQLSVDLSAGGAGNRVVLVVLDATGRPISASDMVLYRSTAPAGDGRTTVEYLTESVGGRLEPDGSFRGTRWRTVATEIEGEEPEEGAEPPMDMKSSPPSEEDAAGLKALVADVLRRGPPTESHTEG
jgi:hypothetical protein